MKAKEITLQEKNQHPQEAQKMIFKIIDSQINNYKVQHIADWEKNHDQSAEQTDENIEKLKEFKESLKSLFEESQSLNQKLDFSLHLAVEPKTNHESASKEAVTTS